MTITKTLSSKVTYEVIQRSLWNIKVAIVEQETYDNGKTWNRTILEFGKWFDSREDAEAFTTTKEYKKIFKVCKTMKTFR